MKVDRYNTKAAAVDLKIDRSLFYAKRRSSDWRSTT